ERARQERLIAALGADRDEVARDQRLVAAWDAMSLALCLGWEDYEVDGVGVSISPRGDGQVEIDPWPFAAAELTVHCESRRLTARCASEADLHAALGDAPVETLGFALRPGA